MAYLSICQPFYKQQLNSHYTDMCEILNLGFLVEYAKIYQLSLKLDKNNGYFTWMLTYTYNYFVY